MSTTIHIHPMLTLTPEALDAFCRRHHIRKLSLFGSALSGELHPDSDIDLLVEFEPDLEPGLIGFAGMEIEMSRLLGKKADLRTPEDPSRYFRDEVIATAEVLYMSGYYE